MVADHPNCQPPARPGRVEELEKRVAELERTLALLLAAGLVSAKKIEQARVLARDFE